MLRNLLCVAMLLVAGGPFAAQENATAQPNIVVIIADDLGWGDIGYNNPAVYTPRLDALAAEGVQLTQHYVMPQCTPTRVALMTGRYPSRFGPQAQSANNAQAFPHDTVTLASLLKGAGYRTFISGKWHLGSTPESGPNHFGFDGSYGSLTGAVGMYDHRYRKGAFETAWHRDHAPIPGNENGIHATDLVTDEAVRFIHRKHEKPFFLYLPYHAPHTPLDERGSRISQPTRLDPANPDRWLGEADIPWFHDPDGKIQQETDPEKRLFLAVVHHLDSAIGRVVDALDAVGRRENTVILFSSDNGPQVSWPGNAYPDDLKLTDFNQEQPWRGSKTQVYEGGIRVPGFVTWPGRLAPKEYGEPVHIVDWLPTIAELTGVAPPNGVDWDGISLWSSLRDGSSTVEERVLYWLWGRNRRALRVGDWKLVRNGPEPERAEEWELYDLAADPHEKNDVSGAQPQRLTALHERFRRERAKDRHQPMATSRLLGPLEASGPFKVDVRLSVAIENLTADRISVKNGECTKLVGAKKKYTATITPTGGAGTVVQVSIEAAAFGAKKARLQSRSNRLRVRISEDSTP